MGAFGNALGSMLKRPFIVFVIGVIALLYVIVDYYSPILNIFFFFNPFSNGDFFQSIVFILQWLLRVLLTTKGIVLVLVGLACGSFVLSLISAGYFSIVHNTINKVPKQKGEYTSGLRRYFLRLWWMVLLSMTLGFAYFLVVGISSVPALIVTKAALSGKAGYLLIAILVDLITVIVVFFGTVFLKTYLLFWFPAVFAFGKSAFSKGKKLADQYFWSIMIRLLLLDIIFAVFQVMAINMGTTYVTLAIKWVFYTGFMGFYITYVFALFRIFLNRGKQAAEVAAEED